MSKPEQTESTKSIITALVANLCIAAAKFVGAAVSGSASMASEGIHSLVDTGDQFLLLIGEKRSKKPADAAHPFGYGKERYFWSFVVAVALFIIGAVFSALEGVRKLSGESSGDASPLLALIILGVAALFEAYSLWVGFHAFRSQHPGQPFFRTFLQSKDPSLIVVISEDTAALTGLAIAAVGIIAATLTHNHIYDALGSICIGGLLGIVAAFLAVQCKSLLIGESASPADIEQIRRICLAQTEVVAADEILTMHVAPEQILINGRLTIQPLTTMRRGSAIIDAIKHEISEDLGPNHSVCIELRAA